MCLLPPAPSFHIGKNLGVEAGVTVFKPSDLFASELLALVCRMNKQCKIFILYMHYHLIVFASCFLREGHLLSVLR